MTLHSRVLVGDIVLEKPHPGQAPRSAGADAGNSCSPGLAIPLVELGCGGPEHMCFMAAGTEKPGWSKGHMGPLSRETEEPTSTACIRG